MCNPLITPLAENEAAAIDGSRWLHALTRMAGRLKGDADRDAFGVDSYYERGTTTTRANTTLFVAFPRDTAVLAEARAAYCERLFGETPNYIGVRQVRNLCFVDYEDIKSATAAMMKNQGHEGLTIDYDKDSGVASKRKRYRSKTSWELFDVEIRMCDRFIPKMSGIEMRRNRQVVSVRCFHLYRLKYKGKYNNFNHTSEGTE